MKRLPFAIFSLLSLAPLLSAYAQNYPLRPVRLIVTVPPGGAADLVARVMAQKLGDSMGQTFVVDNRAGGGGQIAADTVAKAAPDGYTTLLASITTHGIGPHIYAKLPYDPVKDFAPVCLYATMPMIMVANAQLPVKNVPELIALAKAKPNSISFASSGSGGAPHLVGELFKNVTGAPLQHVLGAIYVLERLDLSVRKQLAPLLLKAMTWRGPLNQIFVSYLTGSGSSSISALTDPRAWALEILGFPAGTIKPSKKEVQARFRDSLRDVHPDHGGDQGSAGRSIIDLGEARRVLLS